MQQIRKDNKTSLCLSVCYHIIIFCHFTNTSSSVSISAMCPITKDCDSTKILNIELTSNVSAFYQTQLQSKNRTTSIFSQLQSMYRKICLVHKMYLCCVYCSMWIWGYFIHCHLQVQGWPVKVPLDKNITTTP